METEDYKVLAGIGSAIAHVRDKVDLLRLILTQIKPLFDFEDSGILIIDPQRQFYYDWTITLPGIDDSSGNQAIQRFDFYRLHSLSYPGSMMERLLLEIESTGEAGPVRIDYQADHGAITDAGLLGAIKQMGYVDGLVGRMQVRDQLIGAFSINSKQAGLFPPHQYALFTAITDLVALAVANIQANDEILEREREKAILLSLSEDMATVRDRETLWRVLVKKIQPILGFEDAWIITIDNEQQTNSQFLPAVGESGHYESAFSESQATSLPLAGSPYERFIAYPRVVNVWQVADWLALFPGNSELVLMKKKGFQQGISLKLQWAGKGAGMVFLCYRQEAPITIGAPYLFESIASQVAAALANVVANEDILRREREKSLRLALNQALTDEITWPLRLRKVASLLQTMIPFNLLFVCIGRDPDTCDAYGFQRTGSDEYQSLSDSDLQRTTKLPADQFTKQLRLLTHTTTQPRRLTGQDLTAYNQTQPLNQALTRHFRWQSTLSFPMPLARFGQILFSFYHNQPEFYTEDHVHVLGQLQNTLTTVFDKVLAFEEIERLSEQLQRDNAYLREEVQVSYNYEAIVGNSDKLREVFRQVGQVAGVDTTVLIQGETGTGKELIARALHNQSTRKDRVLVKLNCATLPAQLIESELFGHEKGAFTGATEKRIGKFELADGGTIFLDEIGELPLELQAKLLRVLQEREFERLGGKSVLRTNIRVIAATNRDLQQEVIEGRFRSDLFYRLNVFPIFLPALRDRPEDIILLAKHYGKKFSEQMNRPFRGIDEASAKELLGYDWPGNVRELENLLEQAVILSNGTPLRWGRSLEPSAAVATDVTDAGTKPTGQSAESEPDANQRDRIFAVFRQTNGKILGPNGAAQQLSMRPAQLESWEREFILSVLAETRGRVRGAGGAAEIIGLHPNTLDNRISKLGITREHTGL